MNKRYSFVTGNKTCIQQKTFCVFRVQTFGACCLQYRKEIIRLDIATTDRLSNLVCDEASKCYLHTVLEMYFLHYNETKYAA